MADSWPRALAFILAVEGGRTTDTGGDTNYGISANAHPGVDIANLTPEKASTIYRAKYWDKLGLGSLPSPVALVVMDSAVQHGLPPAGMMLQKAYNAITPWQRLEEDGWLGPLTSTAIETLAISHPERVHTLAREMALIRAGFYADLSAQKKYQPYLRGWINRLGKLRVELARDFAHG